MGSEECVSALLEHGASALCRDSTGRTPLHLAASCGHTELLRSLLKAAKKADPLDSMLDYKGYTPTHWAAYHGETSEQHFMSNEQFIIKPFQHNRPACSYIIFVYQETLRFIVH